MSAALRRGREKQVFKERKLVIYGCNELLQTRSRHEQGDAVHAIAVLECKYYSLFILCGKATIFIFNIIFNDERKRRGMCQHICYGCARCTNEAETQVGC